MENLSDVTGVPFQQRAQVRCVRSFIAAVTIWYDKDFNVNIFHGARGIGIKPVQVALQ